MTMADAERDGRVGSPTLNLTATTGVADENIAMRGRICC